MNPESDKSRNRFALLASGANFSCEVLQALQRKNYPPVLLVLPEYPPAQPQSNPNFETAVDTPRRRLLALAQGIEVGYAPASRQPELAALIRQRAIDFILVACWPYLIGTALIESPRWAAVNMHPSLLPDFRGPDPIRQQLAGQTPSFGVTLHLLNDEFDRGDIIAQAELTDIEANPGPACLERRCAVLGVELFIEAMNQYARGWRPVRQTV
jgi:methionyl-tRNA formyltransferase